MMRVGKKINSFGVKHTHLFLMWKCVFALEITFFMHLESECPERRRVRKNGVNHTYLDRNSLAEILNRFINLRKFPLSIWAFEEALETFPLQSLKSRLI